MAMSYSTYVTNGFIFFGSSFFRINTWLHLMELRMDNQR